MAAWNLKLDPREGEEGIKRGKGLPSMMHTRRGDGITLIGFTHFVRLSSNPTGADLESEDKDNKVATPRWTRRPPVATSK